MEFDSISEQVVYLRSRGVHHDALVHNYSVYKGSQSVLFVPTLCFKLNHRAPRGFGLTRVMRSKPHQIEENHKDTQNTNNSTCRGDDVNDPFPAAGWGFIHDSKRRAQY